MGASDRYLSCPAVSHISNLTVASSSATVCVRNAAGYYVHDRFSPVFSVELGRRGEICFDQLTQKAVRNLSQVPSTRRVIPPRVCPRVCGLTSNRGLLKLEEFVPDKPNDQATFAHGRVAEQHELEVAHPATAHFSVRITHVAPSPRWTRAPTPVLLYQLSCLQSDRPTFDFLFLSKFDDRRHRLSGTAGPLARLASCQTRGFYLPLSERQTCF